MADEKPLTKSELVAALKEMGVATKKDIRQIVDEELVARDIATKGDVHTMVMEAADAILAGVEKLLETLATKDDLKCIDHRLNKLETGQAHLKDQIDGLKADLSDTPSQKEFNELKARVDRYHPIS